MLVDLLHRRAIALQLERDAGALGFELVGVILESLLLGLDRQHRGFHGRVIGIAAAAVRANAAQGQWQRRAAIGFAPGTRKGIALGFLQGPETGVAFLHPRGVVVSLGQLNRGADALVVITAMLPVGAVEAHGDSGLAQSTLPHPGQLGSGGENGHDGEGDDGERLEHGYLTSGCLIKAVRVMGSVRGCQGARCAEAARPFSCFRVVAAG